MKRILYLLCIILFSISFTGCFLFEEDKSEYMYEVTGTSTSYSVTIENADGNSQQWNSVSSGWCYKWEQTGERWLYVSAQNNKSSGNVTVKIYKDGKVIAQNTSYGGYTIATVSGKH